MDIKLGLGLCWRFISYFNRVCGWFVNLAWRKNFQLQMLLKFTECRCSMNWKIFKENVWNWLQKTLTKWKKPTDGKTFRCQFHQHYTHEYFVRTSFSSYVLALNKLSYEKRARITLMKLTTGVNFINIFCAPFSYKSVFLHSLSLVGA